MASLQITEYRGIEVKNGSEVQAAVEPPVANTIGSTTAAAEIKNLDAQTRLVKILAVGGDVHVHFGVAGGTAATVCTTSSQRYVQGVPEWRVIRGKAQDMSYYGLDAA